MVALTEKSKKNEILDAYYELLEQVKHNKQESHQEIKAEKNKEEIVIKAAQFDSSQIINSLGHVKVSISQSLSLLEKQLLQEYDRLSLLRNAIDIESNKLDEFHQIKAEADSLEALILAQKERKAKFENDMQEKRDSLDKEIENQRLLWKLEKEKYDLENKDYLANLKKIRSRDEEDYNYKIMIDRNKEQNIYEAKKLALDKELADKKELFDKDCATRQKMLTEAENEISELRKKAQDFPAELQSAMDRLEKEIKDQLEKEYKYKMEFKEAEISGDKKLQQQIISSLQEKIKEQDALIRDLSQKSDLATKQVQTIALKALEGATGSVGRSECESNSKNVRSN